MPSRREQLPGQLALFASRSARKKRYVPSYAGDFSATHARLDATCAEFRGLKPYEGRCHGCGRALPWADLQGSRVEPKALHKANDRFQRRMRWLKRKAYNDSRAVLTRAGYEYRNLPPVLVGNLEPQRRGALHGHLALPTTTPLEMTFTRAFIDSMKKWRRAADSATSRAGVRRKGQP